MTNTFKRCQLGAKNPDYIGTRSRQKFLTGLLSLSAQMRSEG